MDLHPRLQTSSNRSRARFVEQAAKAVAVALPVLCLLLLNAVSSAQQPGRSHRAAQVPAALHPSFVVVLDAAHGGTDSGARLTDRVLERDLTLSLSTRLQAALVAHGIGVATTRESDEDLSASDRARMANRAASRSLSSACLLLHATAAGRGIHLFTSSNPPAPVTSRGMQHAAPSTQQSSLRLASELNAAFASAEIPVTLGSTSMQPLDSLTCPAAAVELAPPEGDKRQGIADPAYQQKIIDAIVAAILAWRTDSRQ